MSIVVRNIIPAQYAIVTGGSNVYTANNCKTIIDKFTVTNSTATARTLSVYLKLTSATAAGADNVIIDARNIGAHECYTCPELVGQSLEAGMTIHATASLASALVISASGREIT